MIYFHSFRSPGLIIDIVRDIRALNELARQSKKAGMIILGGGVCKHQIANAMLIVSVFASIVFVVSDVLQRNGADYSVYIVCTSSSLCGFFVLNRSRTVQNTGQEFDGSDSGARPDEAVSWGKIRTGAESVKVYISMHISSVKTYSLHSRLRYLLMLH